MKVNLFFLLLLSLSIIPRPVTGQTTTPSECEGPSRYWSNCRGSTKISGGTYTGDFINGKFHGKGKLENNDKRIFSGEFVDGRLNGFGVVENRMGVQCFSSSKDAKCRGFIMRWTGEFRNYKFVKGLYEAVSIDESNSPNGIVTESKEGIWDGYFSLTEAQKIDQSLLIAARSAAGNDVNSQEGAKRGARVELVSPVDQDARGSNKNTQTDASGNKSSLPDRLRQLKELHSQGLITKQQLDDQVQRLLNQQ